MLHKWGLPLLEAAVIVFIINGVIEVLAWPASIKLSPGNHHSFSLGNYPFPIPNWMVQLALTPPLTPGTGV